jgi:hypothetical protein
LKSGFWQVTKVTLLPVKKLADNLYPSKEKEGFIPSFRAASLPECFVSALMLLRIVR